MRIMMLASLGLLLAGAACTGDNPRQSSRVCAPGATQQCLCPGNVNGVQVCAADGARWGSCEFCGVALEAGVPPKGDGGGSAPDLARDGSGSSAPDAGPGGDASQPAGPKPVMIVAGHYQTYKSQLAGLGPFIVYAWAADPALNMYDQQLQSLAQINQPQVEEWVMFSSLQTAQAKLADASHVTYLKSIGVTGLGYNTEGDKTPASEMQNLAQAVTQFAQLAQSKGFSAVWGPIRATADAMADKDYQQMIAAGLDGVGLQEQKWIESACVQERAAAVNALSARLKQLSAGFTVQVQLMPSRCLAGDTYAKTNCGSSGPDYFHCQAFADAIGPAVDSLAIWASGPTDNAGLVPLLRALRHK